MLTVTLKSPPNDTSTVTVTHAAARTLVVYSFPDDSPAESVTRAVSFAEDVARSGTDPVHVLCALADAEHRHNGVARSGSTMMLAASLFRGI
jgi:hypothetical protein